MVLVFSTFFYKTQIERRIQKIFKLLVQHKVVNGVFGVLVIMLLLARMQKCFR